MPYSDFTQSRPVGLLTIWLVLLLTACSDSDNSTSYQLRAVLEETDITGDPTAGRTLPSIDDPKAQLGMKVFFTKILGAAGDSAERRDAACVSCHHPALGGGDALSLPIGVQAAIPELLGPGRLHDQLLVNADGGGVYDGGPTVPRNAPTTFNIGLWDRALFHDGRVEALTPDAGENGDTGGIRTPDSVDINTADPNAGANLAEAQARFPVTSPEEMKGFNGAVALTGSNDQVRDNIAATMNLDPDWVNEFNAVYGSGGVTYARIAEVIGEYQRSQVFVNNPWKAYVEGDDDAISDSAKRGAILFFRSYTNRGANCASCHSGDFFTDEQFHAWAMPQVGRGKGDDSGTGMNDDDFGRFRVTGVEEDKYAFRTPSLLNVAVTGPWTHAGAYTTLESVIRHKADPVTSVENYVNTDDYSELEMSGVQLTNVVANTQAALDHGLDPDIQAVALSEENIADLVAFLNTLTDPCVVDRTCIARWIPDVTDTDPDGMRIIAVDEGNNPL